jgi:FG-GAP-like repeat
MNDSKTAGGAAAPDPDLVFGYSGVSVSTDGGATFTRLSPSPFATGHGTNFGDPNVVYNQNLGQWFAADLAAGCGGQGLGLWTSLDALTWAAGACAHTGTADDRNSMWVDNNPGSPHYGRMYMSWNDFAVGSGALEVTHSDDGTVWSPVVVSNTAAFMRDVQLTGGPDGTVFLASMDEGGGGLAGPRHNIMFRSLDGGVTWTASPGISMGASFLGPGDSVCASNSYFAKMPPIWRHMGWGQPGVGPNSVVHYAYAGKGVNATDTGDIYYVRSTDNGLTWSTPIVLNTDQAAGGAKAQWMPSLSVTQAGDVHVYWYDRRNTTDGQNYQVYGRQSRDNGLTWLQDEPVSSALIAQPAQPDPDVQACYAGDYNYASTSGNRHYATWTDGRVQVAGVNQQDVFFAAVDAKPILCCHDFNGDKMADILWRYTDGSVAEWQLSGTSLLSGGYIGLPGHPSTTWSVVGVGDFNGDGNADILWRNNSGDLYIWLMSGTTIIGQGAPVPAPMAPMGPAAADWQVAGIGDFNGDGHADILWRTAKGDIYIWTMNGLNVTSQTFVAGTSLDWQVQGVADFDGDGKADILWRHTSGVVVIWLMNGTSFVTSGSPGSALNDWQIAGVGDFNGDKKADILWRHTSGVVVIWLMNGTSFVTSGSPGSALNDWQIAGVGDFNGDGKADILWRHTSGVVVAWLINGTSFITSGSPGTFPNLWQIE